MSSSKRIGIFSGTFDPVHRGHIEACVVALGALELNNVLILIEKQPRRKQGIASYIDRANMVELATLDYPSLQMVDLETDNISTSDTLAYLEDHYPGAEYWYIVGSDMLEHIADWPQSKQLLEAMRLCVVLRSNDEQASVDRQLDDLHKTFPHLTHTVLPSVWSPVSSSGVKRALQSGEIVTGIDPAVAEYIKRHQLYGNV